MMHRWEEDLCDKEARANSSTHRHKVRKDYVVCAVNENGGLYPIAVFSDPELAAGYINKQNELQNVLTKALPWFKSDDVIKFRLFDFVVDSNV